MDVLVAVEEAVLVAESTWDMAMGVQERYNERDLYVDKRSYPSLSGGSDRTPRMGAFMYLPVHGVRSIHTAWNRRNVKGASAEKGDRTHDVAVESTVTYRQI